MNNLVHIVMLADDAKILREAIEHMKWTVMTKPQMGAIGELTRVLNIQLYEGKEYVED